jgi:hypothetical protein
MALVKLPWPIVVRKDKFSALFNGGIYIGQPDAVDPRTEPKDAILIQEDGTQIQAEQPIKIGVNGLPTYNGSVVAIDVTGDFSILIVDALDAQQYYYPSIGESSDLLVTDLRSIAFDLGLTFDDIGVKLVTDEVGTSLDNAEFILNTTTGEVWVLPTSIPSGSVVVSLSGSTLTTNNGDFELQSTSNDEYEMAPNRILLSQMVVEGTTGQPLPENGTLTAYAIGNEMALGWVVTESVVDGTKDANGNVTATSGKVRYTTNKDEKGLIGVAQLFGSVIQSDGTNLTQVYADGSGITLGENATTVWLEIDFSQSSGFFYVAGISEQRGRLESKSVNDLVNDSYQFILNSRILRDVTSSRTLGVTYTNTDPVERYVSAFSTPSGNSTVYQLFVDGVVVIPKSHSGAINAETLQYPIPPGSTYSVQINGQSLNTWYERGISS